MAVRLDDLTIIPVGGSVLTEIVSDVTTPIGVFVQLRGASVTCDSASVVVTRGGASVTLSASIASGEVTASLTPANLATLGASIGDSLRAWFEGTVDDSGVTLTWRLEMVLMVSDRAFRFPFDYQQMLNAITILGKACSIPTGQTTHWPQVLVGLEELRDDINLQASRVKTALLGREGLLKRPAMIYGTFAVLEAGVARTTANLQNSPLALVMGRWEKKKASCLSEAIVALRDGSDWQEEGFATEATIKAPQRPMGRGTGIGGIL